MNMKNTKIECKCIDMTIDGFGVCKHDSLVIFVKQMLPDEVAVIKIIAHKKNLAYGIIDEMISPSKYRIKSICPVAYKCGGCDLRHCQYGYGLKLKKELLEHTMELAKVNVEVQAICASPLEDHYRNKVQIPVQNGELGFYRKNSNDIVKFDTCFIQTATENEIINAFKTLIHKYHVSSFIKHIIVKEAFGTGEVMVALIVKTFDLPHIDVLVAEVVAQFPKIASFILNLNTREDNVVLGTDEKVMYGSSYIIDEFDGLEVEISLKSFYQVNYHQMLNLYAKVKEVANINKNTVVLDLFSGIGTISLYLARYAKHVISVEIVDAAVENAKANAKRNNLTNVDFILGDAKDDLFKHLEGVDVVVVDPPRKGLHADIIKNIAKRDVDKVVYVSCNPATMARDLKLFEEEGYHFDTLYPFDMFPHTMHVECIALLQRQK